MMRLRARTLVISVMLVAAGSAGARARSFLAPASEDPATRTTIVGRVYRHTVRPGETLIDIARKYDMGITELQLFYPNLDQWLLEEGSVLQIPALWILPPTKGEGIVINVPELRLYYFIAKYGAVWTYPVTVGEKETPTPVGTFRVVGREVDPTWNIPVRLQYKYKEASMPPGDDNPIGKYWLGLSRERYGIHGTDNAWSVGRIISNGCIRLYPEDMEKLFPEVPKGTFVFIVYQPVKFGFKRGEIYVEVHEDIYGRIKNPERHARALAKKMDIEDFVDWEEVRMALHDKSGVPVPVGTLPEGGEAEELSRSR
jgi:L,D-transpeptidase ErfK/SrfK